jgi:formylglycine-generating enzyme required for sulfatase activity
MARIEKTVFISYRRTDVYTALAVYENLKNHGYDVFFDYRSISSGDFEQVITSNIRARAHFLLILTPTALDRLNEPGDWLRREIEIAIEEKRNIIPLFFRGFRFGTPAVSEKLIGRLKHLSRYNGLNVHEDYFEEAMHRLRTQYLSIPLDTVLHPVSNEVQKVVREEQVAADEALQQIEDVKELVKQDKDKPVRERELSKSVAILAKAIPWRLIGGIAGGVLVIAFTIWVIANLNNSPPPVVPEPTQTSSPNLTSTSPSARISTPTPTTTSVSPTPTPGIGSTMISDKDGMTLLYVPAGEFIMGSENGSDDEQPVHTVYLDAFWIDQTEVTNNMYMLCVDAGVCKEPADKSSFSRSRYYSNSNFDNYPVIFVDWSKAKTYCEWADRRLPTEAEWEKAARGTDGRTYPWGENIDCSFANYWGSGIYNCIGDTDEAGQYPNGASFYGALDMAGNVSEWVNDFYSEIYYQNTQLSNPLGPDSGSNRLLRGGSWLFGGGDVRSSDRFMNDPARSNTYFGFRCAVSVTP